MDGLGVKELMVPLPEYATVPQDATLSEAIMSLEAAQSEFDQDRYRHRAILVYDDGGRIIGKISQMDLIKALEPDYLMTSATSLARLGVGAEIIHQIMERYNLWNRPLEDLCHEAANVRVCDVMYAPTEDEHIEADASLQECMHRLIMGGHHSLLVTDTEGLIIGVLRLTDVFAAMAKAMKEVACEASA